MKILVTTANRIGDLEPGDVFRWKEGYWMKTTGLKQINCVSLDTGHGDFCDMRQSIHLVKAELHIA